jgi:hypothetical protein
MEIQSNDKARVREMLRVEREVTRCFRELCNRIGFTAARDLYDEEGIEDMAGEEKLARAEALLVKADPQSVTVGASEEVAV